MALFHQAMQGGEALFVIGSRGRLLVEERGLTAAWASDMAIYAGTVTDSARWIADELYQRFDRGGLAASTSCTFGMRAAAGVTSSNSRCCRSTSSSTASPAQPCLRSPISRRRR